MARFRSITKWFGWWGNGERGWAMPWLSLNIWSKMPIIEARIVVGPVPAYWFVLVPLLLETPPCSETQRNGTVGL